MPATLPAKSPVMTKCTKRRRTRRWLFPLGPALMMLSGPAVGAGDECPPAGGLPVIVDSIAGSDNLRLADGRILRLAGIAVPPAAAPDARLFLLRITKNANIRLHPQGPSSDRYGRVLARLSVRSDGQDIWQDAGQDVWIERALITAGLALATLTPGENGCFSALVASEAEARRSRSGYWAVDGAMTIAPSRFDEVAAAAGRFAVYEGKILRVAVRDYAIFLDFGEDWRRALSIILLRRHRQAVEAVLGPMQNLAGKTVQIRGIVERGTALRLRLTQPTQMRVIVE